MRVLKKNGPAGGCNPGEPETKNVSTKEYGSFPAVPQYHADAPWRRVKDPSELRAGCEFHALADRGRRR